MTFSRFNLILVALTLVALSGCNGFGNQDAAVRQAIEKHLSQRPDLAMDKMVLDIQEVTVEGDTAIADVVFRTTMDPPARMAYRYELRRESGAWRVESGHPSASETPHPELGESLQSSEESNMPGELPEGHPPLPQGHPPIEGSGQGATSP